MSAVPQPRPSPMVERFLATLHARGINGHCPFCQKNSWIILENPASIPVYESTMQLRMPGTNMPMATMICNNCGWSGFFSLGALGLLRPQNAAPGAATMANSGAPVGGDPAPQRPTVAGSSVAAGNLATNTDPDPVPAEESPG